MFKGNFLRLCARKGEAPTTVCKNIGLSNAAYSSWDENTVPRMATLKKIAEYFGVSPEELLADSEQEAAKLFEQLIAAKNGKKPDSLSDNKTLVANFGGYVPDSSDFATAFMRYDESILQGYISAEKFRDDGNYGDGNTDEQK